MRTESHLTRARPAFGRLPTPARAFVIAVIVLGGAVFAACLPLAQFNEPLLFVVLLLLSAATAATKVELPLNTSGPTMSISYAVDFASLLLLGPHETMVVAAISALCPTRFNVKTRAPLHRTLFNMAAAAIAVEGAGVALRMFDRGSGVELTALAQPLAAAAMAYFVINTALVTIAIKLSADMPAFDGWREHFLWSAPGYFFGAGAAGLAVWVVSIGGFWMAPLTFVPIYLTYRTYKVYIGRIEDERRRVQETSDLHLATIEALARAIDAKDQTTESHIRRVQTYAAGLAQAAGLSADEIQGVKTAALLHDIGKLAVPEHILSKPGPLTHEEFRKIRIHPLIGAEIIATVPFPYPVAPLVLSHHERWDGKGYPQGLAGERIPIGARILTIVDYYDAITRERPYHRAINRESAVAMLNHEAGRALDPKLVAIFVELLPSLVAGSAETEPQTDTSAEEATSQSGSSAARLVPRTATAFENIALAHREIYALYEIAQGMGTSPCVSDTMAMITSKVSKLVPWSACALFLYDSDAEILRCRFAAGIDAPRLLNKVLSVGQGLSGWVAQHRRTLVNADPRISFDAAGISEPTILNAALVCPLYCEDRFLGSIALYHTTANYYSDDHRRLFERVAEQASAVINNSIVFEQTQEDSLTDSLTGLPNRRSMFAYLARELSRAERLKSELALIVMDVDDFKSINDTYGHHIGDAALRAIAVELQSALHPYDLCVRYAGDEFIVVLSECSREAAEAKRREIQERMCEIELVARPGRSVRLAVSAGLAVFPHDGLRYETLLAEADQRMYRDKASRRGTIATTPPQAPAELLARELFRPAVAAIAQHADTTG